MTRFWISWCQPTRDYRPITFPPNDAIIGWWCSGEYEGGNTLCAVVDAKSESEACRTIQRDWPEAAIDGIRFCEVKPNDWKPSDRFPITGWMIDRFDKKAGQ